MLNKNPFAKRFKRQICFENVHFQIFFLQIIFINNSKIITIMYFIHIYKIHIFSLLFHMLGFTVSVLTLSNVHYQWSTVHNKRSDNNVSNV